MTLTTLKKNSIRAFTFLPINVLLVAGQFIYILLRFKYINLEIPFWYTKSWGDTQLAPKIYLYLLPTLSLLLVLCGLVLKNLLKKFFIRYLNEVLEFFVIFCNVLIFYSLVRIVFIASTPFEALVNPFYLKLLFVFFSAFITVYFLAPMFINYTKSIDLITNPQVHSHPAMLLQKPTARGGGFFYSIVFLVLAFYFVGFAENLLGFYLSILMLGLLGFADDFQNTHKGSAFKALENPMLRLFLLFCSVSLVVVSGIKIGLVTTPFGGTIQLSALNLNVLGRQLIEFSALFTLFWLVLIPNLLSWSNGIDGQFSGIIGISSLVVAFLALRFSPLEPIHEKVVLLALISSGISFGLTKYTWYPSKILWGFGAVSAGLVISVLGILVQSKVVVTILIILIPFLDGLFTMFRRILQKKNPLRGDRGHLHHILLDRGWSVPKIALFYWISTAMFGLVGILSSEAYILQMGLFVIGLIALFIVLMNLSSVKAKKEQL